MRGRLFRAWVMLGLADATAIAEHAAKAGISTAELLRSIVREWIDRRGAR